MHSVKKRYLILEAHKEKNSLIPILKIPKLVLGKIQKLKIDTATNTSARIKTEGLQACNMAY